MMSIDKNKKDSTSLIKCLKELTEKELEYKNERISENLIRTAAFPYRKTLEDFDFEFNESIDKDYIMDLATMRFIDEIGYLPIDHLILQKVLNFTLQFLLNFVLTFTFI